MSVDSEDATKLLAAAGQCPDRKMKLVYVAEARLLIDRERERIRQQALLLDEMETEIVRSASPDRKT